MPTANDIGRRKALKLMGISGAVIAGGTASVTGAGSDKEDLENRFDELVSGYGEPTVTAEKRIHNGELKRSNNSPPSPANSKASDEGNVVLVNVFDFPGGPTINNFVARRGRNLFVEFEETLYKLEVPSTPSQEIQKVGKILDQKERQSLEKRFEKKTEGGEA